MDQAQEITDCFFMKINSFYNGGVGPLTAIIGIGNTYLHTTIGGVDPAARDYILSTIIGSYNPEAAVIITTHLIHDIEPVLDEFAFMGFGGRILLSGMADEVRAEQGKTLDELFREVFRC